MSIELRPYRDGDETQIRALFQETFGRSMSEDFWAWRYRKHPEGGPHAILGWDGEKLISHYATMASALSVCGDKRAAALSMTTMVHPDYRGQRLFERCAEELYSVLGQNGVEVIYGFPNSNSLRGFLGRLDWQGIIDIPSMKLLIPSISAPRSPSNIEEIHKFDADLESYLAIRRQRNRIGIWKDVAYMDWRYFQHPQERYSVAVHRISATEIGGYLVVKSYLNNCLDIVDIDGQNDDIVRNLLEWAICEAMARGLTEVASWSQISDSTRVVFESLGFRAAMPITFFGARCLNNTLSKVVSEGRLWSLSMSDSDVY